MAKRASMLCLALVAGLFATPASAVVTSVPVEVDLTISMPDPPPVFQDLLLTGQPTFYKEIPGLDIPPSALQPSPPPVDIGKGGTYHFSFTPGDPCFGAGLCQLDFSLLDGLTGDFSTAAFLSTDTIPGANPSAPPILPIGTLDFSDIPRAHAAADRRPRQHRHL